MKHQKAFTLIEILVVMSMIGIFVTILITQVTGSRNVGNDSNKAALARNLTGVLESYKSKYGTYPTSVSDSGITEFQKYTTEQLAQIRYVGFDVDGDLSTCEAYSVSAEMNSSNARELQHDNDRIIKYIDTGANSCATPDFSNIEGCSGVNSCVYGKPAPTALHPESADWIFDLSNLSQ